MPPHPRHRVLYRSCERRPAGEPGRDRGTQRAAGPVRVPRVDSRAAKDAPRPAVPEEVQDLVALQVTSLDQRRRRAAPHNVPCSHFHAPKIPFPYPRQNHRFGPVRRDDGGQRHQLLADRCHGLGVEQLVAAGRDHHRVEDVAAEAVAPKRRRDHMDDFGVGQQCRDLTPAGMSRAHAVDLAPRGGRGGWVYPLHAQRILCG